MNSELATLEKLRVIARQYVSEIERDLRVVAGKRTSADREKEVRSLRTLLKIIEEIAELEERLTKTDDKVGGQEMNAKQRDDLARRIKAIRRRN